MNRVCLFVVTVLEPSAFAAAIATRSSLPTSSSSTIITARPTCRRPRRPSTITRTRPTSTRGAVTLSWSSAGRPRHSMLIQGCTPGRTSRQCSTAAVDDVFIIITTTTSSSSMYVFLALSTQINRMESISY